MNIVNKLTFRHIKSHTKRTVLTVIAIIVSVAMVTAVFTGAFSFINYFKEVTLAVDGNQHVAFNIKDINNATDVFSADEAIEEYGCKVYLGYIQFSLDEMVIGACDNNLCEMRNVQVSEGHYPEKDNEIMLTRDRLEKNFSGTKIGDTITLEYCDFATDETVTAGYTLCGITDSEVAQTDEISAYVLLTPEIASRVTYDGRAPEEIAQEENEDYSENSGYSATVYVRYEKLDKNIYGRIDATANALGDINTDTSTNTELLVCNFVSADSQMLISIGGLAIILLLIISVVSVFMIYDSFAVSYQERAKYLGILASVGATRKQKRQSVYFEAFLLGIVGIPVGIASGIGGMAVTFHFIQNAVRSTMAVEYDGALKVHVNAFVIVGTIIATAITLFVSAYIPARRASKTTPVEAIRQADRVNTAKARKLRVSKLTGKIFGFEGVMAVKNYKRNGRRSKNIVFALSLSVIVFLAATNFTGLFASVLGAEMVTVPDMVFTVKLSDREKTEEIINGEKGITECFMLHYQTAFFPEDSFKEGETDTSVQIFFVDNATLDAYLKELGEKTAPYHDLFSVTGILLNTCVSYEGRKLVTKHPLNNLEGKTISADIIYYPSDTDDEPGEETVTHQFVIGKQTTVPYSNECLQMGLMYQPILVLSADYISALRPDGFSSPMIRYGIDADDSDTVFDNICYALTDEGIGYLCSESGSQFEATKNIMIIAKVFIYGFITLITMISIMNIINTIYNAMNERRREFAMLRSVGMTPKSFSRMIYLESFRYGGIALLVSLPISVFIHYAEYKILAGSYDFGFTLNLATYLIAAVAVFVIIFIALLYSMGRIKEDNIIENLRTE